MRVSYSLGAVLAGVIVAMLVHGMRSHRVPDATRTMVPADESDEPRSPESEAVNTATGESGELPGLGRTDDLGDAAVEKNEDQNQAATEYQIDEARMRNIREAAVRDVHDNYTLLLGDLDLTSNEQEELLALLVEVRLSKTSVRRFGDPGPVQLGVPIPEAERSERITAIIGQTALQRFLSLEDNVSTYRQTYRITTNLARRGMPLTERQRDGMFDILAATEGQASAPMTPATAELGSLEFARGALAQIDERERLVIELAPSVLSPEQVVYLDGVYQRCSRVRNDDLQRQIDRRDRQSGSEFRFGYRICGP